jgi:trehalose 6-phosphate phosphatase
LSSNTSTTTACERAPPLLAVRPEAHAFFLDLDGTLLEFAPRPEQVECDATLLTLLAQLSTRSAGALALVSGRSIADLDRLTAPHRFPASGVHGLERRSASQRRAPQPVSPQALTEARQVLQALARRHPRLLLEDKGISLALHYRGAPALADTISGALASIAALRTGELRVQHGHKVIEVMPAGASKATAIAAFMDEAPFAGRRPVYVGDDLTDECAFEWVNSHGGLSIAVAPVRATAAIAALASVAAVRAWLQTLTAPPGGAR